MTKTRETAALEERLDHTFASPQLLGAGADPQFLRAGTARPGAQDDAPVDNEQLEFIGDSVLGFVTSQELVKRFPTSKKENSPSYAHTSSARGICSPRAPIRLGNYLALGRGEERSGGRNKSAILVDALEAVIAAIYQDGGLRAAHKFILREILRPEFKRIDAEHGSTFPVTDYKSALQEQAHAAGRRRLRTQL